MLFASHLAAFCTAFSTKMRCVQHQNALHLAPKRTAFSGILQCIQHQNALHLAANRPQNGCKWQCLQINNHFPHSHANPFFASKRAFARIDYLRQGWQLVSRKGTHNVKFLAENQPKVVVPNTRVWAMAWQACTLSTASASGCRSYCLRTTCLSAH